MRALDHEFTFAGFSFPRYLGTLPAGSLARRLERFKQPQLTGGYYHAPKPNSNAGKGFYLDSDGQPCARWKWASDREFSFNDSGDSYRGILLCLPHGRFLAGAAMGEHMSAGVDAEIFTGESEAIYRAEECARIDAENQREWEESENARIAEDEREADMLEVD